MNKSFFYISLGCKVNNYENSAVADSLIRSGYKFDRIDPGVVFINTCSVTATADQKSRQHIRKLINKYPNAISVVMGCYSQGNHDFIRDEIKPNIIIGTSHKADILSLLNQYIESGKNIDATEMNPRQFCYEELGITSYQENARAYLKIEDGCNNFCSYCVIPYRRGKARSRNKEAILEEAINLVNSGYKEIVLTGINVSFYGQDLENESFTSLVNSLLNINNLYRLRISSIEDSEIEDELIDCLKKENLAKHFHIPLQSGSESVLKRMNRKYTCDSFYNKIKKIKDTCPDVCLTTDVIVGFPNETEEEFMETYEFIKKCEFNMLHVFPYSPREGTPAARMNGQISSEIKKVRCLKLIELSNQLWDEYSNKYVGKEVEVLIEGYDKDKKYNFGHTSNYLEVMIVGDKIKEGTIVKTIYKKYWFNHNKMKMLRTCVKLFDLLYVLLI